MKPISIRFKCFGSYKKEMFVDFEKLERGGLFLICGETGAGKTTILDAMCYALYGKSSGGSRGDITAMRCKLAEPSEETLVEFTFTANGKCYRFLRSLRFGRKNLLDSHNCMVLEDGNFVPIFENPKQKNVNQKAEEILGLNYEQFRQVVILPQGQFEKLLVSNSEEKEKILVSLFQADKWQVLSDEIYRRVTEKDKKLREEIADIKSRLSDDQCETLEDLKLLVESQSVQLKELERKAKNAEVQEKAQRKHWEEARFVKEQFAELSKRQEKERVLLAKVQEMDRLKEQVQLAEKVEQIKDVYDAYCTAKEDSERKQMLLQDLQQRKAAAEETLAKVKQKIAAHEAGKPAYESGVKRLTLLENARELYRSLEQKKTDAIVAQKAYEKQKQGTETVKKAYEQKHRIWVETMELQKQKMELYAQAQEQYLGSISGTLAERLESGKPCPVCGSVQHPNPAKILGVRVTEKELDKYQKEMLHTNQQVDLAAKEREKAEQDYQKSQTNLAETEQQATHLRFVYEEGRKQMIEGILDTQELEDAITDLSQRIEKYKELTTRFQTILTEAQANVKAGQEALLTAEEERKQAETHLEMQTNKWIIAREEQGFVTDADYVRCYMIPEEKNQKKEQILRFQTELQTAGEAVREAEVKIRGKENPDIESLQKQLAEAEAFCKASSREWILAQQSLEKKQKDLQSLSKRKEAYEIQRTKVDADLEFANRLRGRTGVSLQRYVLGVMLSSITVEANRLLKHVHGGRYQLYRTDAISGSGQKGGLELEVLDMQSNERRSVTTLSGGEKFLVALSLAIGLSTVVQAQGNGIRLGAMFIDEGFGSLDQNSIYDALEVLQGIQKANGLVGIISHVDLLKDVIPGKIEVRKGENGSELSVT